MDRNDRSFIFGTAHHCMTRGAVSRGYINGARFRICDVECYAAGRFNRRAVSKARRAAGRREIREAVRD